MEIQSGIYIYILCFLFHYKISVSFVGWNLLWFLHFHLFIPFLVSYLFFLILKVNILKNLITFARWTYPEAKLSYSQIFIYRRFSSTMCMIHKGLRGFRALSPASIFGGNLISLNPAIPYEIIHSTLCLMLRKPTAYQMTGKMIKFVN